MKATIEQLAALSLFSELRSCELENLQPHTELQTYRQSEIVVHEGDLFPPKLHVLFTGVLQVQKTSATGKETILRRLRDGDIFAAPALFGDRRAPATVLAIEECQILTIPRELLLQTIQETPELALRILVVFNQRLQQLHKMVHGLVSERAVVRLAQLIQYSALQHGTQETPFGEQLKVKLPYYEIARSIGITYEECARLMKKLQSLVVYQRGGKIFILDQEGLAAIAEGQTEISE